MAGIEFEHGSKDELFIIPSQKSDVPTPVHIERYDDVEQPRSLYDDPTFNRALARAIMRDPTVDDGTVIVRGRE